MPFYSDSEAYYAAMRVLFACVQENYPQATEAIGKSRLNIRVHTTEPNGDVMILGRETPVRITFGENGVKPDLEIDMASDTFHKILLGELGLKSALGSGQMKVKGPIWKALSLGGLFEVSRKCYPDIINGQR